MHRAVCPAWHGGGFGEAEQLAGAYHSALELAAEYHCESVAFPLLSSGNYGYPKEQAFRIAVDTITQYVMEHDLTVYLVLYDQHSLAVSRKLFASVEEYIDDHYVHRTMKATDLVVGAGNCQSGGGFWKKMPPCRC